MIQQATRVRSGSDVEGVRQAKVVCGVVWYAIRRMERPASG